MQIDEPVAQDAEASADAPEQPKASWVDTLPPGKGWQPDGSFVLPLIEPFEVAGKRYDELRFRRMKLGQMRKMPQNVERLEQLFPVACALTGLVEAILCELDGPDALRVLEVVSTFFERAAATAGVRFAAS